MGSNVSDIFECWAKLNILRQLEWSVFIRTINHVWRKNCYTYINNKYVSRNLFILNDAACMDQQNFNLMSYWSRTVGISFNHQACLEFLYRKLTWDSNTRNGVSLLWNFVSISLSFVLQQAHPIRKHVKEVVDVKEATSVCSKLLIFISRNK